jgi:hypothetical protein
MTVGRRSSFLLTATTLAVVLLGSASAPPSASGNLAKSLAGATAYFDSIVVLARNARPVGARGDQLTIELGYLERLRLGLGSPFRLVDEALHDPRLDSASRDRTSHALLGRLRRGDAYVLDALPLEGSGPWTRDGHGATGDAHLALIDRAIRSSSDPRAGELAVRLAYTLGAAAGTVSPASVSIAVQSAALVRDRELALLDAHDLINEAAALHQDVMTLLEAKRALRAFRVEQPTLAPLSSQLQLEAMNAVPSLVRALDTLERATAASPEADGATASLLDSHFAIRLDELGRARPPVAQVAVTLRSHVRTSLHATNEETLAGSLALADATSDSSDRDDALAALASAVAVRSLSQSEPWFPGEGGPAVSDLMAEFGLAGVTFGRNVPADWRPYFARELRGALLDLSSAMPGLSVDGLRIRFGGEALNDSALAMHDPKTRTLQLSIETSAGTLAHELAHDLDWQAARRMFSSGGGYSTDRAMRERRGALASSMLGLAEARVLRGSPAGATPVGGMPSTMGRPTELFARGADWFVASVLAQQGRSNGFLSVIEDGTLTGYAAGSPAGLGLAGAQSLLAALGEMTYVPDSVRAGFESQWADPRVIDPLLLVRRVLETPVAIRRSLGDGRTIVPGLDGSSILATTRASVCVADQSEQTLARRNLVLLAVDARARAAMERRARYRPFIAAPQDAERFREAVRSAIIHELTTALPDQGVVPLVPATFRSSTANCSSSAR